jgi:serine/threonine protein kinase/DNA-directed RNA polymerase subunit RPC12/RpoP
MSQGVTCPVCHTENRSNAKFCARCGAALTGAPAPQRLQPGALVHNGAYRILRPLSKGGMGMIYLAEDLGAFGRSCVIKEMLDYFDPTNPQETQEARQRFEDEARTLAKLNHPQIPNLLSYFSAGQHNYIVMKYVEGTTLEHFIGQPQTTTKVVDYGVQVCEILEYLGGLNPPVVHQDIKPANIIVDNATKSAWLVDFGVAKARLAMQQNGQVGVKKSSIFGTTGYAPPEQYQGRSEPKSDVYALAATLYHVLTGDDPQNHPFTFPQVTVLPPGVAGALSAALQQNVQRRCTASTLRQALENALLPPAPKEAPTVPLPAASQHESYAVIVTQPIADSARPGIIAFLQQELSLSALEAEVLTWQSPARYRWGIDKAQAQAIGQKLKARGAVGMSYHTSQIHSWRQRLSPTEQSRLTHQGEVFIYDKRMPQDRVCDCHHCHYSWKTTARDQTTLPRACPQCHRGYWYPHRIFRCAVCGHEFTNRDQKTPAEQLYAACPKCSSTAWLPKQQIGFTQRDYTAKLPPTPLGGRLAQRIQLDVSPRGTTIRGRIATNAKWLVSPSLQNDILSFMVDTQSLAARRSHTASLQIISNAGVATVTVEVYVESPPILTVTPPELDFGIVRANDTRSLKLELRNTGEQVLSVQLVCADSWLTLDKTTFVANQHVVRCTIAGDRLPNPGINTTTLTITSNGGALNVPVRAEGLPPTPTVTPQTVDFQIARRRSVAPQPLVIENIGLGLLTGALTSDAPWLRVRDATFRSNYLETLVEVDADALEPGKTVESAVHIVTNGGAIDVPVMVQVAVRGPLEWLMTSGWLTKVILLGVVAAVLWVGVLWWAQMQANVAPPPGPVASATPRPPATPTLHRNIATLEPSNALPPAPVTAPSPTVTSTPAVTFTPAPAVTTSLEFLDRLRTALAQTATQTLTAATPTTTTTLASSPAALAALSTQCSDPRAVITVPLPGQTLRGNIPVYGTAEHAAFRYYKIEIASQQVGGERFSYVVDSDMPVTTGLLAVIDTIRFTNGAYILQLTVVDRSGNFPAPCQVAVTIEN